MECEIDVQQPFRTRSKTWPRVHFLENNTEQSENESPRKKSNNRNIYGKYRYADLIHQAITSSPAQKLTLSQIYSWMIENVPIFKDKMNDASWKNSVRHNLSLHPNFVRVASTGGESGSYWIVNQIDTATTKYGRNRSGSLDSARLRTRRKQPLKNPNMNNIQQSLENCPPHPPLGYTCEYLADTTPLQTTWNIGTINYQVYREPIPGYHVSPVFRPGTLQEYQPNNCNVFSNLRQISNSISEKLSTALHDQLRFDKNSYSNDDIDGPRIDSSVRSNDKQEELPDISSGLEEFSKIAIQPLTNPSECNIDAIIQYELSIDGKLDFI